jgi:BirA family biotin operon repressor/biotin-[acetyl-CoA-carboxylase] ligase
MTGREGGSLAPGELAPLLTGRFGRRYVYAETCESTQRLLDDLFPEGAVAACEEQTGGRGRLGRAWNAPRSTAVLCSVVLRPPPSRAAPELSLVAGIAVAEAVEQTVGRAAWIKWPNDVLLDGGKVAGVLAEQRGAVVVLGIGLNVNQRAEELPARPLFPAISLHAIDGRTRERAPILASLLARLEARYDEWVREGLRALLPALASRDALRGRTVAAGRVRGVALGVAPDGRLELETGSGRQLVAAGEVCVEPESAVPPSHALGSDP